MLLLKHYVSVCSGDEGPPPVAPLPRPLVPHPAPPLAPLPVHTALGEDGEGGTAVAPGPAHGRDGAPDLTPGAEEATEVERPGGDVSGHGPTTETESETETETGTDDDTLHDEERGNTTLHVFKRCFSCCYSA